MTVTIHCLIEYLGVPPLCFLVGPKLPHFLRKARFVVNELNYMHSLGIGKDRQKCF